jgi:hypothetical protein
MGLEYLEGVCVDGECFDETSKGNINLLMGRTWSFFESLGGYARARDTSDRIDTLFFEEVFHNYESGNYSKSYYDRLDTVRRIWSYISSMTLRAMFGMVESEEDKEVDICGSSGVFCCVPPRLVGEVKKMMTSYLERLTSNYLETVGMEKTTL